MLKSFADLEQLRHEVLTKRKSKKACISVCAGAGCLATGAAKVVDAFNAEIEKEGLAGGGEGKGNGCPGFCERGPIVVMDPDETCYLRVGPGDAAEIVAQTV